MTQMKQIKKLGSMGEIMKMIPGLGGLAERLGDMNPDQDLRQIEGIINSMTLDERRNPGKIDRSRRHRIASGSGADPADVNKLLKDFDAMAGMMQKFASMGMMERMRAVRQMADGGMLDPGAQWTLPPTESPDSVRTVYVFEGSLAIAEHDLGSSVGAVVRTDEPLPIASGAFGAEVLVLQGRPIGEPVAQYGPFVMNDQAGIEQAFTDYRRTGFGGWPWPTDALSMPPGVFPIVKGVVAAGALAPPSITKLSPLAVR